MEVCNISGIWKRKGPRNEYNLHSKGILDRLIYNDKYDNLDENLTDAMLVVARKNIRHNIFVINAIMNSKREGSENAVDFQVWR